MKKIRYFIVSMLMFCAVIFVSDRICLAAYNPDRAWCEEVFKKFWWHYNGHIEYQASYKTPSDSNPKVIEPNKHVKKGYVNFTRKGKSVCGGRQYTYEALTIKDDSIHEKVVTVKDSWDIFGNVTKFNYDWIYFE